MKVVKRRFMGFFRWIRGVWNRIPGRTWVRDTTRKLTVFPNQPWVRKLRADLSRDPSDVTWKQFLNPFSWINWSFGFIWRWLVTRLYTTLTPSIPAVLTSLGLIAAIVVFVRRDPNAIRLEYEDKLATALVSKDNKVASVAAERLLLIDPYNLEHQFQRALLDHELGKTESARTSMYRLAVEKEHGKAAFWYFTTLLGERSEALQSSDNTNSEPDPSTTWSAGKEELCHQCARLSIENLRGNTRVLAKKMYAEFLTAGGLIAPALDLYRDVGQSDPSVYMTAARLAGNGGMHTESKEFATAAVRFLVPQLKVDPTSIPKRIDLALALVLNESEDDAISLLKEGMKLSQDPLLRMAAGESMVFKSERMRQRFGDKKSLIERVQLLTEACKFAPKSPIVLEALVQLAIQSHKFGDGETLTQISSALGDGINPSAMHFVMGTVYSMSGDTEKAEVHLDIAAKEFGDFPGLLNNVAVTLYLKGEYEKGLGFVDRAITRLPDNPYIRETRGKILLKMERYKDAISDLERAIDIDELKPSVYEGLHEAYKALGLNDLAERNLALYKRVSSDVGPGTLQN